jgi:hypothetical protein
MMVNGNPIGIPDSENLHASFLGASISVKINLNLQDRLRKKTEWTNMIGL